MPSPSRLATFTANELTSCPRAIAFSTPREPSTAQPPTITGREAAISEPKMNSSRISTIGIEISSADPRSSVDRWLLVCASGISPASCTVAPSTPNRFATALYASSFPASSSPASVITATALDLSLAA